MRNLLLLAIATAVCTGMPAAAEAKDKSLSSTIDMYVFPTEGQDTTQQSKDEAACYEWAVDNAGVDPFDLSKQTEAD